MGPPELESQDQNIRCPWALLKPIDALGYPAEHRESFGLVHLRVADPNKIGTRRAFEAFNGTY
jgi:hypothetical protein